jgi:hypothetical protein
MTPQAAGRLGLAATAASFALTFAVAVAGPSLLEPVLPGSGGQPPWSFTGYPPPLLMVVMTAAAIACGTAGLALTIRASRRGWAVAPSAVLLAGLAAALLLALVPPFGSADHLSYAAYGRTVTTGHNPYTTTPEALARLGDPVARAVQDWRHSASVYGSLATGLQALASLIGGASARLTVFVLSLLNVAAFGGTALLLHRLTRGDRSRQLRAALLWTANPLLLHVLIAGAHVDSQAVVFVIAAAVCFSFLMINGSGGRSPAVVPGAVGASPGGPPPVFNGQPASPPESSADAAGPGPGGPPSNVPAARSLAGPAGPSPAGPSPNVSAARGLAGPAGRGRGLARPLLAGAAVGVLVGLGFAVKLTMALAGLGLGLACLVAAARIRSERRLSPGPGPGPLLAVLVGLGAGFAVTAVAAIAVWGPSSLDPALNAGSYVSIGSPWRAVRSALHPLIGEGIAEDVVKAGAVLLGAVLLALLVRAVLRPPTTRPAGLPLVPLLPEFPIGALSALSPAPAPSRDEAPATGPASGPPTTADPPGAPSSRATLGSSAAGASWATPEVGGPAGLSGVAGLGWALVLVVAFAWLFAWPYVLPWYDSLGWALLAAAPWSRLDGLLLARTTALALGYLPARGVPLPAGLGWLETVVRTALTPAALLVILLLLVVPLWREWRPQPGVAAAGDRLVADRAAPRG